jgi:D-tyrosyl-tRNA(Tyr) deacylase
VVGSAPAEVAEPLVEALCAALRSLGAVQTGVFGAMMQVSSVNAGPVTLLLESWGPKPARTYC